MTETQAYEMGWDNWMFLPERFAHQLRTQAERDAFNRGAMDRIAKDDLNEFDRKEDLK